MERTTRTITTSGKHVVVMRDYVTGRELRQIQDVFFRGMEIKSATEVSGFKASAASEAQDVALGILLVSIDGSQEDVANKVLDLPAPEFEEIMAALNEITEPKKNSEVARKLLFRADTWRDDYRRD